MYISALCSADSVNTMPEETLLTSPIAGPYQVRCRAAVATPEHR